MVVRNENTAFHRVFKGLLPSGQQATESEQSEKMMRKREN